jgi:hypothetical protein
MFKHNDLLLKMYQGRRTITCAKGAYAVNVLADSHDDGRFIFATACHS